MAFTYPGFLWGLAAVAIPIFIHLFELRRPKRVAFSNVAFLREIRLVTARQRRLKHWLILLVRVGVIVSLVLLFAQPFMPAPLASGLPGETVQVAVDVSPSMQASVEGESSAFERATAEARDLPTAYPASGRFDLLNDGAKSVSAAAYRTAVDQLQLTGAENSLAAAVVKAGSTAGGRQLFLFSDFQRNDAAMAQIRQLDSVQQVFLVPVSKAAVPNVYVDSLLLEDAFVRTNTDFTLRIRLRNGGQTTAENCPVKVLIGERQAATFRLSLPAQAVQTVQVRIRLTSPERQRCRVELGDFPVTFDNTFYFTLTPSARIPIADISREQLPATQRLYSNEPLFRYQHRVDSPGAEINSAQLVMVQELPRISATLRSQLRQAVQRGATVVIVPAASLEGRSSYADLFRDLGVGPITWEASTESKPVRQELAMPNWQAPFFRDVFGSRQQRMTMPTAAPVLRWSRSATDILRLRDGSSYLSGFRSGPGMVYVFAAPFGGGYSDFTSHALFVPVMYRLAMQSYETTELPAYRLNQGTLQVPAPPAASPDQVARLVKDSLSLIPAQRMVAGVLRLDIPADMRQPGFYTLERAGRPLATLAFNFDKRESELACYSAAELRQLWADRPQVQVYEPREGSSVAARYRAERVGTPLWKYCVGAALLFLFLEAMLLRMGQRRTVATVPA